jgi:hypothetical protein
MKMTTYMAGTLFKAPIMRYLKDGQRVPKGTRGAEKVKEKSR